MSIYGNARQYAYAVAPPAVRPPAAQGLVAGEPTPPPAPGDKLAKVVSALTNFIPGEAVAVFTAGIALIAKFIAAPAQPVWYQVFFFVVLVLSLILYVVVARQPARPGDPAPPLNLPYFAFRLIAVIIAFVVWAWGISGGTLAAFWPGPQLGEADPAVRAVFGVCAGIASPVLTWIDGLLKPRT